MYDCFHLLYLIEHRMKILTHPVTAQIERHISGIAFIIIPPQTDCVFYFLIEATRHAYSEHRI